MVDTRACDEVFHTNTYAKNFASGIIAVEGSAALKKRAVDPFRGVLISNSRVPSANYLYHITIIL